VTAPRGRTADRLADAARWEESAAEFGRRAAQEQGAMGPGWYVDLLRHLAVKDQRRALELRRAAARGLDAVA
jgi:hypothetical protein